MKSRGMKNILQNPTDAEREFRKILIEHGIVTAEQAEAITIQLVDPKDYPDTPRCPCEGCKNSAQFMAFGIEQDKLSPIQFKMVVEAYNIFLGPFVPAHPDSSTWLKKVQ